MQGGRWRAPWVAALSLMALPATAAAELRITAAGTSGDVAIEADVPCSLERQDPRPRLVFTRFGRDGQRSSWTLVQMTRVHCGLRFEDKPHHGGSQSGEGLFLNPSGLPHTVGWTLEDTGRDEEGRLALGLDWQPDSYVHIAALAAGAGGYTYVTRPFFPSWVRFTGTP
jgi:hypothetical protein